MRRYVRMQCLKLSDMEIHGKNLLSSCDLHGFAYATLDSMDTIQAIYIPPVIGSIFLSIFEQLISFH